MLLKYGTEIEVADKCSGVTALVCAVELNRIEVDCIANQAMSKRCLKILSLLQQCWFLYT